MSAYANDPRVVPDGDGFVITAYPGNPGSGTGRVVPSPGCQWGEWEATGTTSGGDFLRHFHATADEAIRQLIGHPR